jgi:branched-chain amino acid transport system ATP-binding protein
LLKIENLEVRYGRTEAVKGISFVVPDSSIVALIGANGAGKTSTLNAITGLVPARGQASKDGTILTNLTTDNVVRCGVAQVAQGRQLFSQMSVRENLELGGFLRKPAENHRRIRELMDRFPLLAARADQAAGTLSGGEQQIVAICRALMSEPQILLIDEPCLGLAPIVIRKVAAILRDLHRAGMTILLAEQNAPFATRLADRLILLENGRISAEGTPDEIMGQEDIRRSYLGA